MPIDVSFGDVVQMFNIGASSCGVYGTPAGICVAADRFGTVPLADLAAPAAALARDGVTVNAEQAYLFEILVPIVALDRRGARALHARRPRAAGGDVMRDPEQADALERLGAEGAAPFYEGDIGAAISDRVCELGGHAHALRIWPPTAPSRASRCGCATAAATCSPIRRRAPAARCSRYALALLERGPERPDALALVQAMERAQDERTPAFLDGLAEPGFLERFMASRLGSTTHISVLDGDGRACSVTCTNGEGSGIVVPGTGMHLNNMLGEQDLTPLGFFTHPPGRRLPSMMAPTVVLGTDGAPELALGSAGSNRIRSAILQVIVNVLDHGMDAAEAVDAAAAALRGRAGLRRAGDRRGRDRGRGLHGWRGSATATCSSAAARRSSVTRRRVRSTVAATRVAGAPSSIRSGGRRSGERQPAGWGSGWADGRGEHRVSISSA